MMWIITFLIILLTICILKDTHAKEYYRCCGKAKLIGEGDVEIPIWVMLVIVLLGLIPIANIILFLVFIIYYAIHAAWDPDKCDGYTHVFSLKGNNIITRCLLKVKNLLCKKV